MQKQSILSVSNFFLLICLTLILQPAFAEWHKDYEEALEFIKKGNYAAAVPKLQSALNQKPEEGNNIKFYGMKFGDYFPHYYLGLAYFNLKNYEAAVREFEISERSGAIQRKGDLFTKMENMMTLARAQITLHQPSPIIAKKEPAPGIDKTPPPVIPKEPEPVKPEPKPIETARLQEPQPVPVQKTPVVTPPSTTASPMDTTLETSKRLVKLAAGKYFDGDYDGALTLLKDAISLNPKDAAAHFLLGCAFASKFLLSGSQDQDLLKNASIAFAKSKRINPAFRVKEKSYFSPAVLEFYAKAD